MCPTCKFHNFASRRNCTKCHAPNPSPAPYLGYGMNGGSISFVAPDGTPMHRMAPEYQQHRHAEWKPGDWICPNPACAFQNFRSRMICLRCRTPRPTGMEMVRPHAMNGGVNISFVAPDGTPMQQIAPEYQPARHTHAAEWKPGDWRCPNPACAAHNFSHRRACFRCHSGRSVYAPVNNGNFRSGWPCSSCSFWNYGWRTECHRCGTGKRAEE